MANGKGGPELSWQTVIAALTAVAILGSAQWIISQTQLSSLKETATADRAQVAELKASLDKYLTVREHNQYRDEVKDQVETLRGRTSVLEATASRAAREPVEKETFNAVSKATDDRVTLLQNAINDVNRQIAAVVFGQQDVPRRSPSPLPP